MSGRQQKKIRQQFAREFRDIARSEAKKLIEEKSKEMDDNVKRFKMKIFKKRPQYIPRAMWRVLVSIVADINEVQLNGLTDV